jgi:hypothetical protein
MWDNTHAFGDPVVPDVNWMFAASSGFEIEELNYLFKINYLRL